MKHRKKIWNVWVFGIFSFGAAFLSSCQAPDDTTATTSYILAVQPQPLKNQYPDGVALFPDTVQESDPIRIYGMAVQRFAAALLFVHQTDPKKGLPLDGIAILDQQGQPASLGLSQEQKDSVIMDFIKFSRRSSIPYQETVKDFELKMMKIR